MAVWQGVTIVIVTWLVTGGMVYGIFKTTLGDHERRICTLELDVKNRTISREEFNTRHNDNVDRLTRIEGKVDRFTERRLSPRHGEGS